MDLLNPGPQQAAQRQGQIWTEDQVKQAHALAEALQKNALDTHPIYSPWEGAARMADALAGNIVQGRQAEAQREQTGYTEQQLAKTLGIPIPGQPSTSLPSAPEPQNAAPGAMGAVDPNEAAAIAHMESKGNYGEIGPHVAATNSHPAGYALGKYQVMNYDLQDRLKSAGLPPMSEQDFLRNSQAQETQFQHEFGDLRKTHSFEDAASMWHSGVPLQQATAQHRTDGYMHTKDYVAQANHFLHNLNPVSTAQAAEAPEMSPSERVDSAFGGNGGYLGNPNGPQTPVPMPRPEGMGPGAPGGGPRMPAPAPAPTPPPAGTTAPERPHIGVTPRPAGTGQPIPGTMSLQQQHAILNLIGQPATHQLGLALAQKYLMPEQVQAPTGYTYMGTPGAGFTPSQMPGLPQEAPSTTAPFGAHAPSLLPGSRGLEVTVPSVGGPGLEQLNKGGSGAFDEIKKLLDKVGPEGQKALKEYLYGGGK